MFGKVLSKLFPPTTFKVRDWEGIPEPESWDPYERPVTECGIVMKAYDVRKTGIEKMQEELN